MGPLQGLFLSTEPPLQPRIYFDWRLLEPLFNPVRSFEGINYPGLTVAFEIQGPRGTVPLLIERLRFSSEAQRCRVLLSLTLASHFTTLLQT